MKKIVDKAIQELAIELTARLNRALKLMKKDGRVSAAIPRGPLERLVKRARRKPE